MIQNKKFVYFILYWLIEMDEKITTYYAWIFMLLHRN